MKIFSQCSLLCFCLLLQSCAIMGMQELKKSSNNKYFDTKGFHKTKRKPLYNKKYITQAKKNIMLNDYEHEDEVDPENIPPSYKNLQMYKSMLKNDTKHEESENIRSSNLNYHQEEGKSDVIDIPSSRRRFSEREHDQGNRSTLESEIQEIKSILEQTREEFAKSKCRYNKNDNLIDSDDLSASEASRVSDVSKMSSDTNSGTAYSTSVISNTE